MRVYADPPKMTGKKENLDVLMTQDDAQSSKGRNRRTERKKRNRQNKKERERAHAQESGQHEVRFDL